MSPIRVTESEKRPAGPFRILHKNGTYYRCMTAIGPCFGESRDTATTFATHEAALLEQQKHWLGFLDTTVTIAIP